MKETTAGKRALTLAQVLVACVVVVPRVHAQSLDDVVCSTPAPLHCAESCSRELLGELGNAIEPETGRAFFLDYPCDLAPNDKVLFILSLHGAGSIGNWQRHYFPALDYKDEYRLVIATPTAAGSGGIGDRTVRMWTSEADDVYLRNVAELVIERFGRDNIAAFWLAGHSQGGMTSNRIVCTDYFRDKVDGWLSLSGGRIGRAEVAPDFFGPDGPPPALASDDPNVPRPGLGVMPDCDISFIFTSGEHEIVALPAASPIAERYGCGARERRDAVVDTRKGYVTGASPGRGASWGRDARPGSAEVYSYPDCRDGRVVADVLRIDKGHTEGLEPRVTEALIAMMAGAPGGKLAGGAQTFRPALRHVPEVLEPGPMRIELVKEGLYLIRGPFLPCAPNGCSPGGNDDGLYHESGDVALRVTPEGLILVDDKFPNHVEGILDNVRSVSSLPVRYVLNTHHHGDHVSGNVIVRQMGIDVIAHENIRANFLRINQPGEPNIVFSNDAAVFLGGVEARLLYFGPGHTNGDTVIYFPDLGVVHAGDLIIDGMPVIDYGAGGSAVEFVRTIDALLDVDFDTLIPGHGRLMSKEDVFAYKARFEEMNRRMRNLARRGVPKADARAQLYLEDLGWDNTVSTTTWAAISFDRYYDEMATQ